ncbi:MAG: hypothetical protein WBG53_11720 [Rhodococcus sp. (in: high G+C Gram-positive bacteria)]
MSLLNELEKLDIVGQTLQFVRTAHNLTVEQVANVAGINPDDLRSIEASGVAADALIVQHVSQAITELVASDLTGKIRLRCNQCGECVVTVTAPPPPVPVTCPQCRNAR